MSSEEPTIHPYNKSFLLIWHILFGLTLIWFTFILSADYLRRDRLSGLAITIVIALLYFLLMFYSSRLFNQKRYGIAYFLTITGFLATIFLQFVTCANIIPFQMH
jgi:tryptophan-rich sensory protein